jgi:hypothetical protein
MSFKKTPCTTLFAINTSCTIKTSYFVTRLVRNSTSMGLKSFLYARLLVEGTHSFNGYRNNIGRNILENRNVSVQPDIPTGECRKVRNICFLCFPLFITIWQWWPFHSSFIFRRVFNIFQIDLVNMHVMNRWFMYWA